MSRPRTVKIVRDLWAARGRVTVMVLAIAVALTGVAALLVARAVITREAAAAYASTNPAAATLDVDDGVDPALLAAVRTRPGIADATTRQTVTTRVLVDGQWRRMLLFVVDPADALTIAKFRVESGSWPPTDDGLLIERAADTILRAGTGDALMVAGPDGSTTSIRVDGTVYDPALAPAAQERSGYGYLTPTALARLGFTPVADQLKITVTDRSAVDSTARDLAAWLTANGHVVHEIQAPPFQHPHQRQTNAVTALFLAFAAAALVLAAVLVAATLGGMLAAQTRQIGAMKTVGATTGQLLRMYLTATAATAVVATLLAVGPGLLAGYGLVDLVGTLLNIDIADRSLPWWVPVGIVASGVGIPVLVALVPILRAARITVRAALDDHGTGGRVGLRRTDRWLARLRGNRTTLLAVRNLTRRRGRLALTVLLLAAGGALFTAGLNSATAWRAWVDQGMDRRAYDAELQLTEPVLAEPVVAAARAVPGVTSVEAVLSVAATPADVAGRVEVQRTYPDGGHGSFTLTGIRPDTAMVRFDVRAGRWLRAGDRTAVVLNQDAASRLGNPAIGSEVGIAVDGRAGRWRVVGTVAEVGGPATAYTIPDAMTPIIAADQVNALRYRFDGTDPRAVTDRVETAVAGTGATVVATMPTTELRNAVDGHVVIFVYVLVVLAALMATVGLLGLASAMSITVIERTREYGIMQAIGATPHTIRRLVLTEGAITGIIGCLVAIAAGIPLSTMIGDLLGNLSFGLPVPLRIAPGGLGAWLLLVITGAIGATLTAAQRAARLTIRETLTYQ
ncbi:ABC transporter permease [Micromonospora costi]|uniref:ABC transporter permease n=1 Tax=Micromonospora costi TaxID=1530042 RepID=A0A3A9ZYU0_9ACTN|nr:ABC transporter permease [Micromonospora costi]RKN53154.1 ABC transporter permease [Micromonospora costi]